MLELLASTRLQILLKLSERPHTISELSKALGFSKTTASYHLEKLESSGLVQRVERGKWVYYKITDRGLKSVRFKLITSIAFLSASIISALATIARIAQKIGEAQAPAVSKEVRPSAVPTALDNFLIQIVVLFAISIAFFVLFLYFRR